MRLVDEVAAALDGLSQLRVLIASGRKAGILEALDFDFIEVEAGRAYLREHQGTTLTIQLARCMVVCRHPARLGLRLRGPFPPFGIAGLYNTGAEGGLSQADNENTGLLRAATCFLLAKE